MRLILITTICLSCALSVTPIGAKTWHVPGDAATIRGGIGLASSGDTILVACGTYYEHDIRMKSGVCLRSETGEASCVTIDAQQHDRVIYCRFVAKTACIEGFTITGGLPGHSPEMPGEGAGLYCLDSSSPSVKNCVFTGNSTFNGGGVCCAYNSNPSLTNCTITDNAASNGGSGMCFSDNSSPTLTDCTISNNDGEGIWTRSGSAPTLTNCTIAGNSGGGIYCGYGSGSITLTDCSFLNNSGSKGGGMEFWNSSGTLTNCTFTGNAAFSGGAIYLIDASVTLIGCLLTDNSARNSGGGIYVKDSQQGASYLAADTTQFRNNTASKEGPRGYVGSGSEAVLTCCVHGLSGFAGDGTITLNNEGCWTPTEGTSWGRIKALYK